MTKKSPKVHGWPREAATTCEGRSRGGRLPKLGPEQGPLRPYAVPRANFVYVQTPSVP